MKWEQAVVEVLGEAEEPLHYAEITERIIHRKLRDDYGATPKNSVSYILTTAINKHGDKSRFERVESGVYKLRDGYDIDSFSEAEDTDEDIQVKSSESEVIHAFGMYWDRDSVDWMPTKPKLLGQQLKDSKVIDFGDQIGVYLLHDRREVIYVGRTTSGGLSERLKRHTQGRMKGRWDRFSWFGVLAFSEEGKLIETDSRSNLAPSDIIDVIESILIESLEPRQNRQRGDNFDKLEFLQVVDPAVENKEKEKLLEDMKKGLWG